MWSHAKTAVLAAVIGAVAATATVAVAGSGAGGIFNLGQNNTVNQPSALSGATAGAQAIFYNSSTASNAVGAAAFGRSATAPALSAQNLGAGPALALAVGAGHAPLTVNSATKVANLNADRLDGLDSTQLQTKLTVEGWHEVGTAGQPAFFADEIGGFAGVWRNAGGSDGTVAYFKDPFGVVHLKGTFCFEPTASPGSCMGTELPADSAVFQLPAGSRPSAYHEFPVVSHGLNSPVIAPILIAADGTVLARPPADTSSIRLDGITFRAGS